MSSMYPFAAAPNYTASMPIYGNTASAAPFSAWPFSVPSRPVTSYPPVTTPSPSAYPMYLPTASANAYASAYAMPTTYNPVNYNLPSYSPIPTYASASAFAGTGMPMTYPPISYPPVSYPQPSYPPVSYPPTSYPPVNSGSSVDSLIPLLISLINQLSHQQSGTGSQPPVDNDDIEQINNIVNNITNNFYGNTNVGSNNGNGNGNQPAHQPGNGGGNHPHPPSNGGGHPQPPTNGGNHPQPPHGPSKPTNTVDVLEPNKPSQSTPNNNQQTPTQNPMAGVGAALPIMIAAIAADPLVLDLNGDGIHTSDQKVTANINGENRVVSNISSGDGVITLNGQILGDKTDLSALGITEQPKDAQDAVRLIAKKAFESGLISSDSNLTPQDLQVLQDTYGLAIRVGDLNGKDISFAEAGVNGMNLSSAPSQTAENFDGRNNMLSQNGTTFSRADGSTGAVGDIWFK